MVALPSTWWPWHHKAAQQVSAPWEYSLPRWDALLGGDTGYTDATYTTLDHTSDGLPAPDVTTLSNLARQVAAADLTGTGRQTWPGYWPPPPTTTTAPAARCKNVDVLAASPAALPVPAKVPVGQATKVVTGRYAKVLVAYTGTCGPDRFTRNGPGVTYVYATTAPAPANNTADQTDQDQGRRQVWVPVRSWDVPTLAEAQSPTPQDANEPADWQLSTLGPCGAIDGDTYRARTVVAQAFAQMCADAKADAVVLVLDGGYRTRKQQADLFAAAVKYYGSVDKAKQWVSYADEKVCESKACAGLGIGVEPDASALGWLNTAVGCVVDGKVTKLVNPTPTTTCPADSSTVTRSQQYGFVAPAARIPGYLEFVLGTGDSGQAPADCDPQGVPVPVMVASVFRCRLDREGVPPTVAEQVVAQALVVSRCSSQWNPAAQLYAGRYARQPNPSDGRTYSEAGVFALRGQLADAGWVTEGRAGLLDPVDNINAAASLWLSTRGWEQFPCATGTDPQLNVGPVLPQYGGPPLPAWATQY